MIIGYCRCSTKKQDTLMQFEALKKYGVAENNIYEEHESGLKKERLVLNNIINKINSGDTLVVYSLDRLSRSTKQIIELIESFDKKGINFVSLTESIDTSTATGRLIFKVFATVSEFERDRISERTKEQLQLKKQQGIRLGRPQLNQEKIQFAFELYEENELSISEILRITGVGKTSFYKYLSRKKMN